VGHSIGTRHLTMGSYASLVMALVTLPLAQSSLAHEIAQKVGGYQSSDGEHRSLGEVNGSLDLNAMGESPVTAASYVLNGSVEQISYRDISKNNYMLENFPLARREQQTIGLTTSHTIKKLTDVRAGASWSTDQVTFTRSVSGGMGHWWHDDTVQTNVDFSQTSTNRPSDSILDNDFQTVTVASKMASRGATFSVKHLATPTTVWNAGFTRILSSERPRLDAYSVQVKQFIPSITGAVHVSGARLINTGEIGTDTTLGSMTGTQAEVAILKEIVTGTNARASYRYCREDEETRAFGDHLVFGSDSYSLGLTQDIKKGELTSRPMTLSVVGTRYLSNADFGAFSAEAGLATKF
jgi:hypothetical protein